MSTNNYRLIPRHQFGRKLIRAGVKKITSKNNEKFINRLKTDPKFKNAYNEGSDEVKRIMRETGDYAVPTRRTSSAVAKVDKTSKEVATVNKAKQKATNVGKDAASAEKGATNAGKKTPDIKKKVPNAGEKAKSNASKYPIVLRNPAATDLVVTSTPPPGRQTILDLLKRHKKLIAGATVAGILGASLLAGNNEDEQVVDSSSEGELGDTPQLVNNFGHLNESELNQTPIPEVSNGPDPSLQTNPRDVNNNTTTSTTTSSESQSSQKQNPAVVQTTIQAAPLFPTGYVVDRRGVRHQLDRIADGAYGSNTYELVIGLENTPDSNPFKRALMNRLGMSVWNSNEAYNRLAQMGIRGYIGGSDRKRLRNLINSGTNINGEIYGFKTGGKLKLVKRYV